MIPTVNGSRRRRKRKQELTKTGWIGFGALIAIVIVAFSALIIARSQTVEVDPPPPLGDPMASLGNPENDAPPPEPISLPANARVTFIGDSWTEGYGARPLTFGYAYRTAAAMGWQPNVFGVGGTGYTVQRKDKAGNVIAGTYAERIATIPPQFVAQHLVVLQGSTNDYRDAWRAKQAGRETFTAAQERFPGAAIVVMGPCPSKLPADPRLIVLDNALALSARGMSLHYVSCRTGNWITPENYAQYFDVKLLHPNAAGYQYLADRLVESMRGFVTVRGSTAGG